MKKVLKDEVSLTLGILGVITLLSVNMYLDKPDCDLRIVGLAFIAMIADYIVLRKYARKAN